MLARSILSFMGGVSATSYQLPEIIDLTSDFRRLGTVSSGVYVPAIGGNPSTSTYGAHGPQAVLENIRAGESWIRVGEGSGLPSVGILDAYEVGSQWWGTTRYNEAIFPVSGRWTRIPQMRHPVIVPPLFRYFSLTGIAADCTYPLGGWIDDQSTGYLRWNVAILSSSIPQEGGRDHRTLRATFNSAVSIAVNGASSKIIKLPAFYVQASGEEVRTVLKSSDTSNGIELAYCKLWALNDIAAVVGQMGGITSPQSGGEIFATDPLWRPDAGLRVWIGVDTPGGAKAEIDSGSVLQIDI